MAAYLELREPAFFLVRFCSAKASSAESATRSSGVAHERLCVLLRNNIVYVQACSLGRP